MSPSSTPDAQLLPIARHLVEERPGGLLGLAVFGSAATSRLRPDSDIDLIMVTASSLTTRERRELVELLLITSGWRGHAATFPDAADRRPIELTSLVSAPDTPWRACPRRDFQFGEWLRADLLRGNLPAPADDPDLVILAATALHGHRVLFGPPLDALIAPIPREVLDEAMIAAIPELLAGLPSDERNTLLTLARILVTLETGRIVPKDTAAAQIAGSLSGPGRRLLTRAGDEYREGRDGRWTGDGGDVADLATELARRAMQLDTRRAVGRLRPTTPPTPRAQVESPPQSGGSNMATLTMLRDIASELPDVREGTHFGMVAFSVAGKGFISVTKDGTVQLLMGPDETERALAAHPTARPIERRGRPIGIGLPLADVDVDALRSLVRASYAGSA